MFGIDLPLLALPLALGAIAVFAWRIVRADRPSLGASRARMDAAGDRLRELLDRESEKARLLRLDSVNLGADALEVALCGGDDCATWADRLFARCAGGGGLHYDGQRGHWTACVPLFAGGPTVAFAVDERDRRRPFEALLAALEILALDAPPVVVGESRPSRACARFSDSAGLWQAYQPCDACGGGWLNTTFDALEHEPLARLAAGWLLVGHDHGHQPDDGPAPMRCLHCAAG